MANIKPLSEAVQSSVRSGIILFDLSRVVEELIYNSLDAGATKVSVFIGIGTCYVKVVDDGSGITRDGLVLLGERYATSRVNYLADMDAAAPSFGFRGEALGSISNVSLLEVVTKAHGRPNGYRKVMKGCKCLYLGIDDDRQDVGSTVVVRDLFYNQPVRRKHMQSSPKKVLHSVRKCVLHIALVHSNVALKVVDIESEDNLLCTLPSSSPLSLLASNFGNEISSTLHELNLSDGILELSGYVSSPYDTFSVKALQYVYINSRYVSNGPIHKLLYQLATRFKCLDPLKVNSRDPNGKRSRSEACPSYFLNLSCPRSCYDLNFEPAKTSIQFKDWVPILTFIERVVTQFWSENIAYGNSFSHASGKDEMREDYGKIASLEEDLLTKSKTAKKVCRIESLQASHSLPSSPLKMLTQDIGQSPNKKDCRVPFPKLHEDIAEHQNHSIELRFSTKSWDAPLAKCTSTGNQESDNHLWTLDKNFCSTEDKFLGNNLTARERSDDHVEDSFLGSTWGEEFCKVDPHMYSGSTETAFPYDCFEFSNDGEDISKNLREPFLRSSRENLLPDEAFGRDESFEFQNGRFRTEREKCYLDDRIDAVDVDGSNQSVNFRPRALWQDVSVSVWPSPKSNLFSDINFCSRDNVNSYASDSECFVEDDKLSPISVRDEMFFGSGHPTLNSEWHPLTSDPLLASASWDVQKFTHENAHEWGLRSGKGASCEDFANREVSNCMFSFEPMLNGLSKENCLSSSSIRTTVDFKGYAGPKRETCKFLQGHTGDDILSPTSSYILTKQETDWLSFDSSSKYYSDTRAAVSSKCIPSHRHLEKNENRRETLRHHDSEQYRRYKIISRRSHSAPPFYRGKKVFVISDHFTIGSEIQNDKTLHEASTFQETSDAKNLRQSSGGCYPLHSKSNSRKDSFLNIRPDIKNTAYIKPVLKEIPKGEKFEISPRPKIYSTPSIKDFSPVATQECIDSGIKWRNSCREVADGNNPQNIRNQCNILDISSGILHLTGDSLVPEFINRKSLEDAKVLQQVDKKFIPVVANGTLAIIDQHAADERIRLEELRQKVLSGEVKTITYLDTEQELVYFYTMLLEVLPEIGYQLLQNYAEQIQNWGWICNIHAQGLKSFTKNMSLLQRRPAVVTLLAVPCILGVNLSDVDLLEFLQQLADTDGSSTMPPSVHRVLNFKACRGAIMFGDTLLPSECSLIVEELKQTSLCFQCAHGRPTTVPLVNLEALHKQITRPGLFNDGSKESWHGLRRHEISFKRAVERLNSARG